MSRSIQKQDSKPVFIFDIGGVVIKWKDNDPIFRYVAKRYHLPFAKTKRVMHDGLADVEWGRKSCEEYIEESLARLGKEKRKGDNAEKLITLPFEKLAKTRLGTIQIIRLLKKKGYKVYALSNTSRPHVEVMRKKGWTTPLFDRFFASCEIRALKPHKDAYLKVLKEIHVKPENAIFIDNSEKNIEGAIRAGIGKCIHFHSLVSLRKEISKILNDS